GGRGRGAGGKRAGRTAARGPRARGATRQLWHRPRWDGLGRTLPADKLAAARLRELAPVMHEEAAGARELVSLARDHAERELLVGQVRPGQLQRLGRVVRVDVDRRR